MKKIVFLAIAIALAATGIYGQSSTTATAPSQTAISPETKAKEATDKLSSKAQLSQDQYTRVLEVNKNYYAHNGFDRPASPEAMEREQKIKAILSTDQWEKVHSGTATVSPVK